MARSNALPSFVTICEGAPGAVLARHVLRLAWPSVAEQLFFGFAQMLILTIVGGLGPEAIAAVGVSNQLQWFLVSGFFALGAGATTVVARSMGAGDADTARDAARQAASATVALAVLVGLAGFMLARPALRLMGLDAPTTALAAPYLRLLFAGIPPSSLAMCLGASLRGAGDTRTPMMVNAVGTSLNVLTAYLLVGGRMGAPALGLTGAGISFILSGLWGSAVFLIATATGRCGLHLSSWSRYRPDFGLLRRILNVGIPSAAEQLAMSLGILMFVRVVTSLGMTTYAAHQIAVNLTNLTFPISMGFAISATALVGQSLGARRLRLAERYAYAARVLAFGLVTALSLVFALFSLSLARMYTTDGQVTVLASSALRIAAISQPGLALYMVLAGALRGAGDTRWPLYMTLVGIWVVRLSLGYLGVMVLPLGLYGVWGAIACDQWARAVLVSSRFRSRRWQTIRV
ncbi:MAG: MATE family efflux transporter [Bacillota bacterium]